MLETILSTFLGGGATGLFGVAIQRFADYKNKQLDIEINKTKFVHEINLREIDSKIMAQEWAARAEVAQIEASGKMDVADSEAFSASFNEPIQYSSNVKTNAGQGWTLVILDFIRGIVRPGLTLYLCVLTTMIYFQAHNLITSDLTPEESLELVKMVIGTVLYLTTTCVMWWFGTRNKSPAPKLR